MSAMMEAMKKERINYTLDVIMMFMQKKVSDYILDILKVLLIMKKK